MSGFRVKSCLAFIWSVLTCLVYAIAVVAGTIEMWVPVAMGLVGLLLDICCGTYFGICYDGDKK